MGRFPHLEGRIPPVNMLPGGHIKIEGRLRELIGNVKGLINFFFRDGKGSWPRYDLGHKRDLSDKKVDFAFWTRLGYPCTVMRFWHLRPLPSPGVLII